MPVSPEEQTDAYDHAMRPFDQDAEEQDHAEREWQNASRLLSGLRHRRLNAIC